MSLSLQVSYLIKSFGHKYYAGKLNFTNKPVQYYLIVNFHLGRADAGHTRIEEDSNVSRNDDAYDIFMKEMKGLIWGSNSQNQIFLLCTLKLASFVPKFRNYLWKIISCC